VVGYLDQRAGRLSAPFRWRSDYDHRFLRFRRLLTDFGLSSVSSSIQSPQNPELWDEKTVVRVVLPSSTWNGFYFVGRIPTPPPKRVKVFSAFSGVADVLVRIGDFPFGNARRGFSHTGAHLKTSHCPVVSIP
jgi:hypothetical protein